MLITQLTLFHNFTHNAMIINSNKVSLKFSIFKIEIAALSTESTVIPLIENRPKNQFLSENIS